MAAYRGLSGIDSALLALLFVELWRDADRPMHRAMASACAAGFLLKISFELATGTNVFVESMGPATSGVPLAHLAGAASGFLIGVECAI